MRDLGRIVRDDPPATPSPPSFDEALGGGDLRDTLEQQQPRWEYPDTGGDAVAPKTDYTTVLQTDLRELNARATQPSAGRANNDVSVDVEGQSRSTSDRSGRDASCVVLVDDEISDGGAGDNTRRSGRAARRVKDAVNTSELEPLTVAKSPSRPISLNLENIHTVDNGN